MVLNYIWVGFFLIAFIVALLKLIFLQDFTVFDDIVQGLFGSAKTGFELSIGLTGALAFWLGIMKIGEKGGAIKGLAWLVSPLFRKLFPDLPKDHPAVGAMMMNISANMLGLDNAATPLGLKAMNELQTVNKEKDTASNSQIMFLVLNTSGLTLIPVTIMAYRATAGALNPADVFIPILIATYFSTLGGLIVTSTIQKINLFQPTVLAYLGTASVFIFGMIYFLTGQSKDYLEVFSKISSGVILFGIITAFILLGLRKKVNVYESFIEGAKEGFEVAIKIIPYLIAMLCAIAVFRASGAMDYVIEGLKYFFSFLFSDLRFVDGLPTAIMKPLSGSGARGLMLETYSSHGVDSFVAKLTSVLQGSTETTFYVLAVYFGSAGIRNTRYAAGVGLFADLIGVISAIIVAYIFFG